MNKNSIVTINGQQYDAQTGLPVESSKSEQGIKRPTSSNAIHSSLQRSKTLLKRVTKKPTSVTHHSHTHGSTMDITKSNKISRFAPHSSVNTQTAAPTKANVHASHHPIAERVNKNRALQKEQSKAVLSKSSQDIKHEAITAALARPTSVSARRSYVQRHPRAFTISVISAIILIVGGYLTYVNLPGLSVRIAAVQAGINATYPGYHPDGYRLDGPVTFSDGQVTINFTANTGSGKFSIKESKSTWDSLAVLDNVVRPKVGEEYITNLERGLTIYTYDGNATWVNGGILYNIEGDAPLSGDQLRRIATSL